MDQICDKIIIDMSYIQHDTSQVIWIHTPISSALLFPFIHNDATYSGIIRNQDTTGFLQYLNLGSLFTISGTAGVELQRKVIPE